MSSVGEMTRSGIEALRSCQHGKANRMEIVGNVGMSLIDVCGDCGAWRVPGTVVEWIVPRLVRDLVNVEGDERAGKRKALPEGGHLEEMREQPAPCATSRKIGYQAESLEVCDCTHGHVHLGLTQHSAHVGMGIGLVRSMTPETAKLLASRLVEVANFRLARRV